MSKSSFILIISWLIVLTSFLGIPSSWKTIIVSLLAIGIVALASLLRRDITSGAVCMHLQSEQKTDVYTQNSVLMSEQSEVNNHEEKATSGSEV
jgi:hypothetical protein